MRFILVGGVSAAVSKTAAAPIERVKLLIQNQVRLLARLHFLFLGALSPKPCSCVVGGLDLMNCWRNMKIFLLVGAHVVVVTDCPSLTG